MAEKRKASEDLQENMEDVLEESIQEVFERLEELIDALESSPGDFDEEAASFLGKVVAEATSLIAKMESSQKS